MRIERKNYLLHFQFLLKYYIPHILFVLFSSMVCSVTTADRFSPPSLSSAPNQFENRFTARQFNTDFLVAHILNNARQIERLGDNVQDAGEAFINTEVFSNQTNSIDGAISNSVFIPPGTVADTIIVINQNEGDSVAIQR